MKMKNMLFALALAAAIGPAPLVARDHDHDAVKHNPFPYVAAVQDSAAAMKKQVPLEQLFGDLGAGTVPAFSYIVPDQCRDMHGISNPLAPCGDYYAGTDPVAQDNDYVKRGDDAAYWCFGRSRAARSGSRGGTL